MTSPLDPDAPCPCGSGSSAFGCCGPLLDGRLTAPTAERLMRSRFSAFVTGNADYLQRTWHSSTRPSRVDLDPDQQWTRLDVVGTTGGGMLHTEGTVEFTAYHRTRRGRRFTAEQGMHEHSSFARENGQWVYLSAIG